MRPADYYRRVRPFRAIFLAFMTWLLVVFLPGHTRGAITMNPHEQQGDSCCKPAAKVASCCGEKSSDGKPTQRDRAACAVCWWAAGLLTTPPFVLDATHAERALDRAHRYDAQVRRVALRLTRFGRDPPTIDDCRVA